MGSSAPEQGSSHLPVQDPDVLASEDSTVMPSRDLALPDSTTSTSKILPNISEGNRVLGQPSLEDALLQIQVLMAEKQDHQKALDNKDAQIKKRETLVLTLNQEIMLQDNKIFQLHLEGKQKDAALLENKYTIAELARKVEAAEETKVEVRAPTQTQGCLFHPSTSQGLSSTTPVDPAHTLTNMSLGTRATSPQEPAKLTPDNYPAGDAPPDAAPAADAALATLLTLAAPYNLALSLSYAVPPLLASGEGSFPYCC
ncbi:hypothetical protein KCU62_g8081, partial [Aureobasidium sp. EXF-3399]